jgi:hypothetical protein
VSVPGARPWLSSPAARRAATQAFLAAHPEQIDADGRPTPEGRRAMQRLWVEALDVPCVP